MSESEQKVSNTLMMPTSGLQVATRMLRSPSHESVTTDLSLFSVSSIASDAKAVRLAAFKSYSDAQLSGRGPSPNPDRQSQTSRYNPPNDICNFSRII